MTEVVEGIWGEGEELQRCILYRASVNLSWHEGGDEGG